VKIEIKSSLCFVSTEYLRAQFAEINPSRLVGLQRMTNSPKKKLMY